MHHKIGILGAGQLGKMLFQAGSILNMDITLMDMSEDNPGAQICRSFYKGDITSYQDVLEFGKSMDIITIEIEKVNTEALLKLQELGKKIYPQPKIVALIQDKGTQKEFYQKHDLPSSRFKVYKNQTELLADIENGVWSFPFIQKARKGGYDGRGVMSIDSEKQLVKNGFKEFFLVEEKISINKEIAVITCQNVKGDIVVYDPVEMIFDNVNNILDSQQCPADITLAQKNEIERIATNLSKELGIIGLLAIEFFIDNDGAILINEVAPRPHNSGHHTIESALCSQYENHLRAISDLPLGSTELLKPSILINLLGEEEQQGEAHIMGLSETLKLKGVYPHIYGKHMTKPSRKMGHVTILADSLDDAKKQQVLVKKHLKVIAKER